MAPLKKNTVTLLQNKEHNHTVYSLQDTAKSDGFCQIHLPLTLLIFLIANKKHLNSYHVLQLKSLQCYTLLYGQFSVHYFSNSDLLFVMYFSFRNCQSGTF